MELVIFARFHAREGQETAATATLRDVVGPSRAEPGSGVLCLHPFNQPAPMA